MKPIPLKTYGTLGLSLVGAALVAALSYPLARTHRLSNMDLAETGIPSTHIVVSPGRVGRCSIVLRRASELRRSDSGQPGRPLRCHRIPFRSAVEHETTWLIQSDQRPTRFYVPVLAVRDWTYPFVHQFIRGLAATPTLPEVRWTQLYENRQYLGLYLRMDLPGWEANARDGRGRIREMLIVTPDRMVTLDTRLQDNGRALLDAIHDGYSPRLVPASPKLAWLAARSPPDEATYLLESSPPHDLALLPMAVSLSELFEAGYGRPAELLEVPSRLWAVATERPGAGTLSPLSETELESLRSGFEAYAGSLRKAVRNQSELEGNHESMRHAWRGRQAAVADLGLSLGEL